MLKNYLTVAWRNITRHRSYTLINISGLAIGVAACLLLFTTIRYELSYDRFQLNYDHIYHVASERKSSEGTSWGEGVPFPAYEAFKLQFPQVVTGALYGLHNTQVTVINTNDGRPVGDKKFIEESSCYFSEPQFFSVFSYKWLKGSPAVLKQPNVTVLSRAKAEKYFGSVEAAVDGILLLDNTATVKVAGIIENPPAATDFPIGVVSSLETAKQYAKNYGYTTDYGNVTSNFQAFMLVPKEVSVANLNKQLMAFSDEHYNKGSIKNDRVVNFLRPLAEVHYDRRFGTFGDHIMERSSLRTLGLTGLFILIMACINFINLATAQSVGRSKEVGVRKVLGSNRSQLFAQIMGETTIIVLSSVIIGFGIATLCLPYLKHVASISETPGLLNPTTLLFTAGIAIVVIFLAGTYPSLVLSGFKPALALKNKITAASIGGVSLRRGLVVTQFTISQVLIIGTIIAISQMNYVQHADLGYNKDAILVLNSNVDSSVNLRQPLFKQKLLSIAGVQSVSFSSDIPSSESNNSGNFSYDHGPDEQFDLYRKFGDEDFFKTYSMQFVSGRPYEKSDTAREVVVNETLVKKLNKKPEEVLGHDLQVTKVGNRKIWCFIVGVVKDFKTNSLREDVKPTVIAERNKRYYYTGIKLNTTKLSQTMAAIEKTWNETFPEFVFTPAFLDERIARFYQQETQMSLLYKIFAAIAIFISALGLYGLVSFMAVQKTKEVGIRKVLGASVGNIIYLFSKEFTMLIFIAFIVAAPVAYYMMSNWLKNFVYRIEPGVGIYLLAVLISVLIAWGAVGYRSVKAALANPVKSLRSE